MDSKTTLISPDNGITERMASRLVGAGRFETVEQAWQEAIAICSATDAYENVPAMEDKQESEVGQ